MNMIVLWLVSLKKFDFSEVWQSEYTLSRESCMLELSACSVLATLLLLLLVLVHS
jgi:hypothetical protein